MSDPSDHFQTPSWAESCPPTQAWAQELVELQASEETNLLVAWSGMEARSRSFALSMFSAASLHYQSASHQNAQLVKNL